MTAINPQRFPNFFWVRGLFLALELHDYAAGLAEKAAGLREEFGDDEGMCRLEAEISGVLSDLLLDPAGAH